MKSEITEHNSHVCMDISDCETKPKIMIVVEVHEFIVIVYNLVLQKELHYKNPITPA